MSGSYESAKVQCARNHDGFLPVVLEDKDNEALIKLWQEKDSDSVFLWIELYCTADNNCKWINGQPMSYSNFTTSGNL